MPDGGVARPRVVVAGEALVDLTPGTSDDGRPAMVPVLGGAPFNVAVGAARQGAAVAWTGPVGDDAFGDDLRARLAREGVDAGAVVDVDAPTSLAAVHLDDQRRATYVFYLDGTALRHPDATVPSLADGAPLVVVCGALGFTDEPYGTALAAALRASAGVRPAWLDPNVRPSAVEDPDAYLALLDELVAGCDVVKVSDEDLALLLGRDPDDAATRDAVLDVARRWAASGPGLVVVTLGPDGVAGLRPGGGEVRAAGVAVDVVDTVGAGDTVTASLVASLQQRDALGADAVAALPDAELAQVLRRAAVAAAVTCTRRGADLPTAAEVDAALG